VLPAAVFWVGVALSAFQQFVGINAFFYYGRVLWRTAGFAEGGGPAHQPRHPPDKRPFDLYIVYLGPTRKGETG
jgi:hypothetical protein